MENADVANDLNKYYFLTIWTKTCTATLNYIKKKKKNLLDSRVHKGLLGIKIPNRNGSYNPHHKVHWTTTRLLVLLSLSLSLKCKVLLFLYSCFYTKRLFINKVKGYHIAGDVATLYILDPCIKLEIIKLPMIFSIALKLSLLKTFAQD